jgi:hypothetical protein
MPTPTKSPPRSPDIDEVHALGHPGSPLPQTRWQVQPGRHSGTPAMPPPIPRPPNQPAAAALANGSSSDLIVSWVAPGIDGTHSAATSFSLRFSPSGAGAWTVVGNIRSPYDLTGLAVGAAYDVQVQAANPAGSSPWSATSTLATASAGPYPPNAPAIASIAPPTDGTVAKLTVSWTAPTVDGTHGAATGYNIRTSPHGANTWTVASGVTTPYTVTGLTGATAVDAEVQATNAASSPSAWSSISIGNTWGATVAPGGWQPATSQVHNTGVAPNGGVQLFAVAAPTAVTGASFAWSASATTVPTSGLIAAPSDGQTNGYGQYFSAPATAGTYYLWSLAQGAGSTTIGALVSGPITVS